MLQAHQHAVEQSLRPAERIAETHRLHQFGWTGKDIATHLMLSPKTVRRYLKATLPSVPQRRTRKQRLLDAFKISLNTLGRPRVTVTHMNML